VFGIPVIDVEGFIDVLYVNMKILIYILEFKHLRNYNVAILLNIVSPKLLHRRRSNSQHRNFKPNCLKKISLGNRSGCTTNPNLWFQNRRYSWTIELLNRWNNETIEKDGTM